MDTRKVLAELVGTFLFMSIGYLSVAASGVAGTPNLLVVPFSFGLGLLAAIFAVGHISGGHFNPAVTVAMILDKRTTPLEGAGYIAAQVIGAIGAAAIVLVAVNQAAVTAGVTAPGEGITDMGALIIEIAMTAAFLAVILAATKRAPSLAALAIPLTLVAIHFASATLSGASVNPARSIGSALVGGDLSALWIYLVGPTIGGIVGWGIWKAVDGGGEEEAAAA
jgi:aquaporin Z